MKYLNSLPCNSANIMTMFIFIISNDLVDISFCFICNAEITQINRDEKKNQHSNSLSVETKTREDKAI